MPTLLIGQRQQPSHSSAELSFQARLLEWPNGEWSGCAEALLLKIRVHAAKQHVDEQQADWGDWGATRKTLD